MNHAFVNIPTYKGIGVYALIDTQGRMYIGSTQNIYKRIQAHQSSLSRGTHTKALQKAFDAGEVFSCQVLETLPYGTTRYQLRERELYYIRKYGTEQNGYNSTNLKSSSEDDTLRCFDIWEEGTVMGDYVRDLYKKFSAPILPPKGQRAIGKQRLGDSFDRVSLALPKGKKDAIKAHAEKMGESVNKFISRAIDETMERDNQSK